MKPKKLSKPTTALSSNRFLRKIKSKVVKIQKREQALQLISKTSLLHG